MSATIVAVSSGQPPAAIAVIRVSGPAAIAAAATLAGALPPARMAKVRSLRAADGTLLDRALMLVFPGPDSATGEDLVELHCHGGRAVVAAVIGALVAIDGVRAALPGEFTRRALTNRRIDLSEAEGLADLLAAETETQRRLALAAVEGRVGQLVHGWMATLTTLSARVEALLDYAEDGDVDEDEVAIIGEIAAVAKDIRVVISAPPVERVHHGIDVVLAGPPNAGKSTLLNLLAEREAAIVSPIAGTTRDRIEVPVIRNGQVYRLTDTAGLTESEDVIEAIGVKRAEAAIVSADIVLWLGDGPPPRRDALPVHARSDVPGRAAVPEGRIGVRRDAGDTIERLWGQIAARAADLVPALDVVPFRERQQNLSRQAVDALSDRSNDLLIVAENLRLARRALAGITGEDATETMLDTLFSRFCLGK